MATLREAVESGRRWRWKGGEWEGPGESINAWTTHTAISSDFEIEPEPEKLREWLISVHPDNNRTCGPPSDCIYSKSGTGSFRLPHALVILRKSADTFAQAWRRNRTSLRLPSASFGRRLANRSRLSQSRFHRRRRQEGRVA